MDFDEDFWIDDSTQEIRFRGREDGNSIVFRVPQIALTDRFRTDDTMEEAVAIFENYRDSIENVACDLYENNSRADVIVILSDVLDGYQL